MPGLKERLITTGYSLGWSVVCKLPESWAQRAFQFFGDLAWRREGKLVRQLEANLVRVLGPDVDGKTLRAVSREGMRSYARYWLEVFRLPVMPVERLVDGMRAEGPFDEAFGYLAEGRGVVFALPHTGNWDQAAAYIMAKGAGSITAVVERLKPEAVYEKFVAFREGLGMEVLPASGGARPFGILAQRLRAGRVVVLVADRDVTGTGIEVEFFGEKCMMQPGSAALAVQTGAALMPVVLWFDGDGWGVRIGSAIPVPELPSRKERAAAMMQDVARFFEDGIREHPQDWHMLQPLFVSDLDPERQAAARERAARNGQLANQDAL
ncbi:MAG TPA: phosphatidylinositol mannoside acyltransferase [Streptosporangiaceae bacterium]|jgi:lauroyl/myristoyl acyltransferase|nr:phosphatidylinositol mannoside acyltransferase [Streptosporangiaceae bacterium]